MGEGEVDVVQWLLGGHRLKLLQSASGPYAVREDAYDCATLERMD